MTRYPIGNVLATIKAYRDSIAGDDDIHAEFQAGYDPQDGRIYLGVVVRDDNLVVTKAGGCTDNDAVEIYVQGRRNDPRPSGSSWNDWPEGLTAERMPVLQYVGLPGNFPAYQNRYGENPSLLYASTRERRTQMKSRREDGVTTYEWAIQVYDVYPGLPTQLEPGKVIGLEIAVVDRDAKRNKPAFLTWGQPPAIFKGFEPESLGELYLATRP